MGQNQSERNFRVLMLIYAVMFYVGGAIFFHGADKLLSRINSVGGWVGFTPLPPSGEHFWLFLAVSMMATIATCSLIAGLNPRKYHLFAAPVIVSKFVSSSLGIHEFFAVSPHGFAYLIIFLTDFPLFVLAVYFYARMLLAPKEAAPVSVAKTAGAENA